MTLTPIGAEALSRPAHSSIAPSFLEISSLDELQNALFSKGITNQEGIVLFDLPSPPELPPASLSRLEELLNECQTLETTGTTTLKDLLGQLPHSFELVGSMVLYVLGVDYLNKLLNGYGLTLSPSLSGDLTSRFPKGRDIDLRAKQLDGIHPGVAVGQLSDAIATLFKIDSFEAHQSAFKKIVTVNQGKIVMAALGNMDFVIYENLTRDHFALIDALRLPLNSGVPVISGACWLQPFLDHLLKAVRIDRPETVENGWARLLWLKSKGFFLTDPSLEKVFLHQIPHETAASKLLYVAKTHFADDPESALKMAYQGLQVLSEELSPTLFSEFCKKIEQKSPLLSTLSDPKTKGKELIRLYRLALPLYPYPGLSLTPLSLQELLYEYKNYKALKSIFNLKHDLPFKSLNHLLFDRLLIEAHPYPLWRLLEPHLNASEKQEYEAILRNKLSSTPAIRKEFLSNLSLTVNALKSLSDPKDFNAYFTDAALEMLNKSESSHVAPLLETGSKRAEILESHDLYARIILLTLSCRGNSSNKDLKLDFQKISDPELRLKTAATLSSHKKDFQFTNSSKTLGEIKPTPENDAYVRELFNAKKLTDVPNFQVIEWAFAFYKEYSLQFRPWLSLFTGPLKGDVAPYAIELEALISELHPTLPSDVKAYLELIKAAAIQNPDLNEALVKTALSHGAFKDKALREPLWKLLASIRDPEVWNEALKYPSLAMTETLYSLPSHLPDRLLTGLFEGLLQVVNDNKHRTQFFEPLRQLKSRCPASLNWIRWLLATEGLQPFTEATREMNAYPSLQTRELNLWMGRYLALDESLASQAKEQAPHEIEALTNSNLLSVDSKAELWLKEKQYDKVFSVFGKLEKGQTRILQAFLKAGMMDNVATVLITPSLSKGISFAERHVLVLLLMDKMTDYLFSLEDKEQIAIMTLAFIKLIGHLDSTKKAAIEKSMSTALKLMQRQVILGNQKNLNLQFAALHLLLCHHSNERTRKNPENLVKFMRAFQVEELLHNYSLILMAHLPNMDHNPTHEETSYTITQTLNITLTLMNTPLLTTEGKWLIANYAGHILGNLFGDYPQHRKLGQELLEKLTYFIAPHETGYNMHRFLMTALLLSYALNNNLSDEEALFVLKIRFRVDPVLYPEDLVDGQQIDFLSELPVIYSLYANGRPTQVNTLIALEMGLLLDMQTPRSAFLAVQAFANLPKLFPDRHHHLSEILWEALFLKSIPHLSYSFHEMPLLFHLINAFFENNFIKNPGRIPALKHLQTFFLGTIRTFREVLHLNILFGLHYLLKRGIMENLHVGNEHEILHLIDILAPFGSLWNDLNKEDPEFFALLDLIDSLKLNTDKNRRKASSVMITHINSIFINPNEDRVAYLKKALCQLEKRPNFPDREAVMTHAKEALEKLANQAKS